MSTEVARLTVPVNEADHIRGSAMAPVTLVEYGDYECPYCGMAHLVIQKIQQRMGDQLRFVYRHFPLTMIHPHSEDAAEAAEAAGARGKFWQMHDVLFSNQHALEDSHLITYAAWLGLDVQRFREELLSKAWSGRVRQHFLSGVHSGVNGTPTMFINGVRHDGSWEFNSLFPAVMRQILTPVEQPQRSQVPRY